MNSDKPISIVMVKFFMLGEELLYFFQELHVRLLADIAHGLLQERPCRCTSENSNDELSC